MKLLVLALVALALLFGARCMTVHKNLIAGRQAIETGWVDVDAALARRAAIVPEFAAFLRAAGVTETGDIEALSDAGNALAAAHTRQDKMQANSRLDQALARILVLVENYSRILDSKKYGDFGESLKSAEYQIAVSRRKYNEAVEHYNARLDMFPDNLVASLAHLGKIDAYFRTPAV